MSGDVQLPIFAAADAGEGYFDVGGDRGCAVGRFSLAAEYVSWGGLFSSLARNKKNSGGLMVHKATHHFDLVNWWLGAVPVSVLATGKREFYTPAMAKRFGLDAPHERCLTCPEKDEVRVLSGSEGESGIEGAVCGNEQYDGYFRDRCVWRMRLTSKTR